MDNRHVQAWISNISLPVTLDEVYDYSSCFNMEMILGLAYDETCRTNVWTVPKWCKKGDVVFFMHAKTACNKIARLRKQLLSERSNYTNDDFWVMMNALTRARKLYHTYGGKIFVVGRVSGETKYWSSDNDVHWKGRIYAPVGSIFLLEHPIDISEFNHVIRVSRQSRITSLFGKDFMFLKSLTLSKNTVVEYYFLDAVAELMPLSKINDDNWIEVVNRHRRSFFLEAQFRTFYADRLLRYLGDVKSFYKECLCKKGQSNATWVDNVIKINGRYLPVEVKLSVSAERDIVTQLESYCRLDVLRLNGKRDVHNCVYDRNVLVIDTENIYLYDSCDKSLGKIYVLDAITSYDDIAVLRQIVIKKLGTG